MQGVEATRKFAVDRPVWRTIDEWAKQYGYRLIEWQSSRRVYEKAHRLLRGFGRWQVLVEAEDRDLEVGARVKFRPVSRPGPRRETLERKARAEANALLDSLGQPPLPA